MEVEARDLIKAPLSVEELQKLGRKLGGVRELVGPKRRKELADVPDEELWQVLADNPGFVRRPIIIVGRKALTGFTPAVRAELDETLG